MKTFFTTLTILLATAITWAINDNCPHSGACYNELISRALANEDKSNDNKLVLNLGPHKICIEKGIPLSVNSMHGNRFEWTSDFDQSDADKFNKMEIRKISWFERSLYLFILPESKPVKTSYQKYLENCNRETLLKNGIKKLECEKDQYLIPKEIFNTANDEPVLISCEGPVTSKFSRCHAYFHHKKNIGVGFQFSMSKYEEGDYLGIFRETVTKGDQALCN